MILETPDITRAQAGLDERIVRRWNSLRAYRQILDALAKSQSEDRFKTTVDQLFSRFDAEDQRRLERAARQARQ